MPAVSVAYAGSRPDNPAYALDDPAGDAAVSHGQHQRGVVGFVFADDRNFEDAG